MAALSSKESEKRLRRIVNKWMRLLGLGMWDINVELAPEIDDADAGLAAGGECFAFWQYEAATIRFHDEYIASVDDAELERLVIHELLHCVLSPMRETGKAQVKHEERTTVNLTRAFQRMMRDKVVAA